MIKIKRHILFALLVGTSIIISCNKEYSCEGCSEKNKPPIAMAGTDQRINLPTDSVLLDAFNSSDADGKLSAWLWTKIAGPSSFTILNPTASKTLVRNLTLGVYQFELMVTDNGGLSAKDTLSITVSDSTQQNEPPVANAGPDESIFLPINSIYLTGSGSSDPNNNISNYAWKKISGPTSYNIIKQNGIETQVTNLVQGTYAFELKVTDSENLYAMDTVQVSVLSTNSNNGILIAFGSLSIARAGMATGTAGNKILFAGGFTTCGTVGSGICNWFSRVDIYDMATQTWSIAELSQARTFMAVATLGNKIFFAGGYISSDNATKRVDIYDASSNTWSTAELSEARTSMTAAAVGDKVFFVSGCSLDGGICEGPTSLIDVYDASSNSWSVATLPEARLSLAAAAVGNRLLFAGGSSSIFSSRVDIYDSSSNSWSIASLSEGRSGIAAATMGSRVYFGGGDLQYGDTPQYSNRVDIYDDSTQSWATATLSQRAEFLGAASDGNRVLFFPYGNRMEIYNSLLSTWYYSELTQPLYNSSIIGAGGHIYVAGGALDYQYLNYTSQVWRVQF